jgi:negative regulator of flagellin synthesis FlgM
MKVPNQINELNGGGPATGSSVGTARAGAGAAVSPGTAGGVASGNSGGGADVHITDAASALASLEPSLREAPAIDPARVAALRAAIEQGEYVVDPEHVANQLLQMNQALDGLRSAPHVPQDSSDSESGS